MKFALGIIGLLLIVSGLTGVLRQPLTINRRFWMAVQFLLAGILFWLSPRLHRQVEIDRSSVIASFNSISADGPQEQLVFHYMLENTTRRTVRIDAGTCSRVSFRFAEKTPGEPKASQPPNPALNLLEKDKAAYARFTGLERLPTTNPALTLDQCPLELRPNEKRAVAIAIPYAYPRSASARQNASDDDLKLYVRASMPQVDGFGMSDTARIYEIDFPRGW